MPTNEERKQIAENLRVMTAYGCRYAEQFYELLNETVMDVEDFHDFGDVANRLADLIEPEPERTCEFTYELGDDGWWWYCSNCGVLPSEYDLDNVPNFCPNCGLKVIE